MRSTRILFTLKNIKNNANIEEKRNIIQGINIHSLKVTSGWRWEILIEKNGSWEYVQEGQDWRSEEAILKWFKKVFKENGITIESYEFSQQGE